MTIWVTGLKDVIGHIASWEEVFLAPLRRYADGAAFETAVIENYLAWNDEQAARKRDIPLSAVLDEATAIRQELAATADRLAAEQWKQELSFPWGGAGTAAQALGGLAGHEMEHVRAIQQWLDRASIEQRRGE